MANTAFLNMLGTRRPGENTRPVGRRPVPPPAPPRPRDNTHLDRLLDALAGKTPACCPDNPSHARFCRHCGKALFATTKSTGPR